MEGLTNMNTLVLPQKLLYKAPTCWDKEKLWFDKEEHDWRFDLNCEQALIAEGIGEHKCPTIGEWVAFTVVGGIVAALTGKYMIPPDPEPFDWTANLEHFTWEALWKTFQEDQEKLDRTFMAAMLRSFLPREYHAPPERPYRMSNFVYRWGSFWLEYPDTIMHSVGNVRLERLHRGRESLTFLPENVVASIRQVRQYIPTMLEIAIKRIQKTYMW